MGKVFGGGGGGTPKYPIKKIRKQTRRNIEATQKDGATLIREVDKLATDLESKINNQAAEYGRAVTAEEQKVLDRLKAIETDLADAQGVLDANLTAKISTALNDFNTGLSVLNEQDRLEFQTQVDSFRDVTSALDRELRGEVDSALGDFEGESQALLDDYEGTTSSLADAFAQAGQQFRSDSDLLTDEARRERERFDRATQELSDQARADSDAFRRDSLAEGDRFIERTEAYRTDSEALADRYMGTAGAAMSEFNRLFDLAGDLSPERLNLFTQAAEYLTQANIQTRMNAINAADPRAQELSAIADENAAAMMSGRISADVQANLARSSAMRALSGGFGAGSEMGRGLAARDLGLTSLDLQQQGFQNYETQRRLNYDTRIAGNQVDSSGLLANDQDLLRARAQTGLEGSLRIAGTDLEARRGALDNSLRAYETDRVQRQSAFDSVLRAQDADVARRQNAAATGLDAFTTDANRRQGVLDNVLRSAESERNFRGDAASRILGGGLAIQDTLRAGRIELANNIYSQSQVNEGNIFGNALTNLTNRTARMETGLRTNLTTNASLAEQLYKTNTENNRQNAVTASNAADSIYRNNLNVALNTANMRNEGAGSVAELGSVARTNRFNAVNAARNAGTASMISAINKNYEARMARAAENNAGIGSLIGMGGSIIGGAIGGIAGSFIAPGAGTVIGAGLGASLGGMAGTAASGSLGYGGYYGGAQGANTGSSIVGMASGLAGSSFGSSFGGSSKPLNYGSYQNTHWLAG